MNISINGILLIVVIWFLQFQSSFASTSAIKKALNNNVIITQIKSNFIDVKRASEIIYFYGDVIIERQDVSILADKMVVYYDSDSKNSSKDQFAQLKSKDSLSNSGAIKRIEAEDNVKIFNGEFVATGKHGIYNPKQNNFILKEDVILNKGSSVAKGQKFVYNTITKKSYLVGKKDVNEDNKKKQKNADQNIDNRVTVIIDDNSLKDSKSNKKSPYNK